MTCRRVLAAGVSQALLLIALGATASSAYADPPPPTAQQLQDAATSVQAAQQRLAQAQLQAEQATEAYNGTLVRAAAAEASKLSAAAALATAQHDADVARQAAADTAARAAAAAADADAAEAEAVAAATAAQAAQQQLDGLLSGAYRSGGSVPLYSALLGSDPLAYATGRQMLDVAGQHQRDTLDALTAAKQGAAAASGRAATAEKAATDQADEATRRAQDAAVAATAAKDAAVVSATAAADAATAAAAAAAAKRTAQEMVDAAQRQVGGASSTAQDLQSAADAAKRDASAALLGTGGGLPPAAGPAASTAIAWAFKQIGVPYAWGGGNASGPTLGFAQGAGTVGFDCSGLTQYAYAHAGVALDHFTGSQWNQGQRVPTQAALLPGDLVFFATDPANSTTIHHVALYIGNGMMIQAPHTGDVVRVSPVVGRRDFIGGVRPAG